VTNLLGLVFDGGLAVLLMVTIGYCARLSRRIRQMQDSRGELAGMIARFDQATTRATASLAELQAVSKRITDALQLKIEKANFMADDLAFLIEKSSKLIVQLEQAKTEPAKSPAETQSSKPKPAVWHLPPPPQETQAPSPAKSAASLEALLNHLASSAGAPAPAGPKFPAVPPQPQAARTGAERELMAALKTGSR